MIPLKKIILHRLNMSLKNPFTTSFGTVQTKDFFIIELINEENLSGFGESVAFTAPWYTEETFQTTAHMIKDFLIPLLKENKYKIIHPNQLYTLFSSVRGNNMAKSALENALWDLYAKEEKKPLFRALGGTRETIDVGVSLGIEKDREDLLKKIAHYVDEGYKRIKIKVKKDHDLDVLTDVRKAFPDISLMVDANSAYSLDDLDLLKEFDQFNLLMIEQPLAHDDFLDHAKLQAHIDTAVCLDESIHSLTHAKQAIQLESCRIINVKLGRVGGFSVAKDIHDLCVDNKIELWSGGMLDAGVGRAHNIALASLPGFSLPGDIASSSHYWKSDIIQPEVSVKKGQVSLSNEPGIGYEVDREKLAYYTVAKDIITC